MLTKICNLFKHATDLHYIVHSCMAIRNDIHKAKMLFQNLWLQNTTKVTSYTIRHGSLNEDKLASLLHRVSLSMLELLLVPRNPRNAHNFSRGKGFKQSLAERGEQCRSELHPEQKTLPTETRSRYLVSVGMVSMGNVFRSWISSEEHCSPRSARDGMTPLPQVKLRGYEGYEALTAHFSQERQPELYL